MTPRRSRQNPHEFSGLGPRPPGSDVADPGRGRLTGYLDSSTARSRTANR